MVIPAACTSLSSTSTIIAEQVQSCRSALEVSSSASSSSPRESIAYKSAQKCLAMTETDSALILNCLNIELCSFIDIDLLSVSSSSTISSQPSNTASSRSTANLCGLMLPSACTDMTESSAVSGQQADACKSALANLSSLSDSSGFDCAMKCFDIAGTIGVAIVDCLQIELCSDMTHSCQLSKSHSVSGVFTPTTLVTSATSIIPTSSTQSSGTTPAYNAADICDLTIPTVCSDMAGSSTVSIQQASACKSGLETSFPSVNLDECALKCLGTNGAPGDAIIDCLYIELCAGLAVAQSSIRPESAGSPGPVSSAVLVAPIGSSGNTASMTSTLTTSTPVSENQLSSATLPMPRPSTSAGSKSGSIAPVSSVLAFGSSAHETLLSTINTIASLVSPAHSIGSANSDMFSVPLVSSVQAHEPTQPIGSAGSTTSTASAASATSAASASTASAGSVSPANSAGSAGTTSLTGLASALASVGSASSPSISRPSDIAKSSTKIFTTSYSGSSTTESTSATYTGAANSNDGRSVCVSGLFAAVAVIFGLM
ncbi:hypothetical protein KCU78_g3154, partial [Aureobasidium melanogenum]